jgi:hypothetical protein
MSDEAALLLPILPNSAAKNINMSYSTGRIGMMAGLAVEAFYILVEMCQTPVSSRFFGCLEIPGTC